MPASRSRRRTSRRKSLQHSVCTGTGPTKATKRPSGDAPKFRSALRSSPDRPSETAVCDPVATSNAMTGLNTYGGIDPHQRTSLPSSRMIGLRAPKRTYAPKKGSDETRIVRPGGATARTGGIAGTMAAASLPGADMSDAAEGRAGTTLSATTEQRTSAIPRGRPRFPTGIGYRAEQAPGQSAATDVVGPAATEALRCADEAQSCPLPPTQSETAHYRERNMRVSPRFTASPRGPSLVATG